VPEHAVALNGAGRAVVASVAWLGSLGTAALYLARHDWHGAADLLGMAFWSLPFAGLVAVTAIPLLKAPHGEFLALVGAVVLGPLLGLGYFALISELRGGWKLAFPAFVCWAFGGGAGFLISVALVFRRASGAALLLTVAMLAGVWWTYARLDEREAGTVPRRGTHVCPQPRAVA